MLLPEGRRGGDGGDRRRDAGRLHDLARRVLGLRRLRGGACPVRGRCGSATEPVAAAAGLPILREQRSRCDRGRGARREEARVDRLRDGRPRSTRARLLVASPAASGGGAQPPPPDARAAIGPDHGSEPRVRRASSPASTPAAAGRPARPRPRRRRSPGRAATGPPVCVDVGTRGRRSAIADAAGATVASISSSTTEADLRAPVAAADRRRGRGGAVRVHCVGALRCTRAARPSSASVRAASVVNVTSRFGSIARSAGGDQRLAPTRSRSARRTCSPSASTGSCATRASVSGPPPGAAEDAGRGLRRRPRPCHGRRDARRLAGHGRPNVECSSATS